MRSKMIDIKKLIQLIDENKSNSEIVMLMAINRDTVRKIKNRKTELNISYNDIA
jgi:DNA-binding CsgD family transcriptional regulator